MFIYQNSLYKPSTLSTGDSMKSHQNDNSRY